MSGFLMGIAVIFTPFFNFFIFRYKLNKKFIPIIILVIVGMYFLCGGGISFNFGAGEVFATMASVFYGLWLVLTPKFVHDIGPVALSALQCGVAAVVCLPFSIIFEFPIDLGNISMESFIALLYVSIICTFIVYMIQNQSLKYITPVFVSLVLCLEPVFSALFSFVLLDEKLPLMAYLGGVLIIVGLMIASFFETEEEVT
jgi:drug/metabolite transporter (DMT)-like permease